MRELFRLMAFAVGSLVAPAQCAACDGPVKHGTAFCGTCVTTLVWAPAAHPDRVAAFVYGGAIAQALRRFKFDDRPDLAPSLVAGLARHLPLLRAMGSDLVVPVPLHPERIVERGYNQAALLARPIARMLGVPCAPRALRRVTATGRQTDLTRAARSANVERAFAPAGDRRLSGRRVLLVDDVETTGSTLAACSRALLSGGAEAVRTVVIARAEPEAGG